MFPAKMILTMNIGLRTRTISIARNPETQLNTMLSLDGATSGAP